MMTTTDYLCTGMIERYHEQLKMIVYDLELQAKDGTKSIDRVGIFNPAYAAAKIGTIISILE